MILTKKRPIVDINIEIKSNQSKINIQNIDQGASSSNSETAIQQTKQIKRNKNLQKKKKNISGNASF